MKDKEAPKEIILCPNAGSCAWMCETCEPGTTKGADVRYIRADIAESTLPPDVVEAVNMWKTAINCRWKRLIGTCDEPNLLTRQEVTEMLLICLQKYMPKEGEE